MSTKLSDLPLKTTYRSDRDSLLRDFYLPALSRATVYQRSAGYFTSASLSHAARGLTALIDGGGRLELIAAPMLTSEDIDAIRDGYVSRDDRIRASLLSEFAVTVSSLESRRLEALSWLIANDRLDVKIAFRVDPWGRCLPGIYHEKIGVIRDGHGDYVAFAGSANETEGGLITNFESIPVYWSWDDPQQRAHEIAANYEKLWADDTRGLRVLRFPEVAEEALRPYQPTNRPTQSQELELESSIDPLAQEFRTKSSTLRLPERITLRDYQVAIITEWLKNRGRGTFALATGTGKTVTALAAAARVRQAERLSALLVVCPYQNLVTQWAEEIRDFGGDPILAFHSRSDWHERLSRELLQPRSPQDPLLVVVTTFSTFGTPAFKDLLGQFPDQSMLIADEAHHIGSESSLSSLPALGFPLRLALSATPERHLDDEGTDKLLAWFGEVLEPRIGVREAIDMGALCPYYYHPTRIDLSAIEAEKYLEFSQRIASLMSAGHRIGESAQLGKLLLDRSAFLSHLEGKLTALSEIVQELEHVEKTLVYCGAGAAASDEDVGAELTKHVDVVVALLGDELGIRVQKYVATTRLEDRARFIGQLVSGDLQAIVAINCLDEGVDIPCIETAILMSSSTNPRQFVQRRGRVLRKHPGKEFAHVYDMIVVPKLTREVSKSEKSLMKREMTRYLEFARSAENGAEAERAVLPILEEFDLLHL